VGSRTLVVTNDFPPRSGGIQSFVHGLLLQQDPDSIVVYASNWRASEVFDRTAAFEVIRDVGQILLPDPRAARRISAVFRSTGCDRVLFGAAAPLGLLAPRLRRAGADRAVGLTHGHEAAWAQLPGSRATLRRIGRGLDTVTYLGEYTRSRIAAALDPTAAAAMRRLVPGVDFDRFSPDIDGSRVRNRHGLGERPVIVCVSRLMARKGQDTLIAALPDIRRRVPDAALLVVGGGPYRANLVKQAGALGVDQHVFFAGSVAWEELPEYYAAADVFAMPCRTRRGGLDVEGLGIVYLEASATGLAVVAGNSGGAPDAVRDGITGHVVAGSPDQPEEVGDRLVELLLDRDRAKAMGRSGRDWVVSDWGWQRSGIRLATMLDGADPDYIAG
jgi:phosphatidylinositol alpha-1,6-mannosyltransferase